MRLLAILVVLASVSCNSTRTDSGTDAAGGGAAGDAFGVDSNFPGDGGTTTDAGPACEAGFCCTSGADIPKKLGCAACGHATLSWLECSDGGVVCNPTVAGGERDEVVVVEDWASGIGDCTAVIPDPEAGGGLDGGTDSEVLPRVQGRDDCFRYDFFVDNPYAHYGGEIHFAFVLANACPEPIDLSGRARWLTVYIVTHGVGCCPDRNSLPPGQHVAILPMDGWDASIWERSLGPGESIWMSLPWHPEADRMVNPDDAPPGLYDAYALPPTIKRDAGDRLGPLEQFLLVRVEP